MNDYQNEQDITVILPSGNDEHANSHKSEETPLPVSPRPVSAKHTVHISTLVIICLLCSLLTGGLCLAGYNFWTHKTQDDTPRSTASGTNLSTQTESNDTTQTGDVTIQVENVTSPATAVAKKVLPSIAGIQITATSNSWYGQTTYVSSEGSGVVYSEDGYIITNYHVIESALSSAGEASKQASIRVYLYTDPETALDATVIGYDISADLAVLKINRSNLTAVELGNSDELQVGDIAIALGNPGGLQFLGSVSQGIISGLNRTIQSENAYENLTLIQTDAAINPGNSGGALVDINGKLIGINSAKLVAEEYEGMGFAIPTNDVVAICSEIIKNGNQKMPYLGIDLNTNYTSADLEQSGLPGGMIVSAVDQGSPADVGGVKVDDILVSFNGTKIQSATDLSKAKNKLSPGDTVTLQIYRQTRKGWFEWVGEYIDISVTLG